MKSKASQKVFWHRDLPPLDAAVMGEHTVEANSHRVPGTLAHRDELWDDCYRNLMDNAATRLEAEIARLGGCYAHVHTESIGAKHDDAADEAWLHGTFTYVLLDRNNGPALNDGPATEGTDHARH